MSEATTATRCEGRANRQVVFIAGAGHSGSTLLGLVLGSHPRCFYAGEASKTRFLGDERRPERKRLCKICGDGCPVWSGFDLSPHVDLYERISRRVGHPVVIDSTKDVAWIQSRASELSTTGASRHLVLLLRDGRAVVNSRLRKAISADPIEVIDRWADQMRRSLELYDAWAGSRVSIRYEELAMRPSETVRRVCRFLGLDYRPSMLDFHMHEHHPLGGNNGTQFQVSRIQRFGMPGPTAEPPERSRTFYTSHGPSIELDLRWQSELSPELADLVQRRARDVDALTRWDRSPE